MDNYTKAFADIQQRSEELFRISDAVRESIDRAAEAVSQIQQAAQAPIDTSAVDKLVESMRPIMEQAERAEKLRQILLNQRP